MLLSASPKHKRDKRSSTMAQHALEAAALQNLDHSAPPKNLESAVKPMVVPGFEDIYLSPSPSQARKIAISRIRAHQAKKASEKIALDSLCAEEVRFLL